MIQIQHFGEYTFEESKMVVMRGIDIIDIPQRQKEVLAVLLRARGGTVTRDAFLDTVCKDVVVEEHK